MSVRGGRNRRAVLQCADHTSSQNAVNGQASASKPLNASGPGPPAFYSSTEFSKGTLPADLKLSLSFPDLQQTPTSFLLAVPLPLLLSHRLPLKIIEPLTDDIHKTQFRCPTVLICHASYTFQHSITLAAISITFAHTWPFLALHSHRCDSRTWPGPSQLVYDHARNIPRSKQVFAIAQTHTYVALHARF